jgi:hypothetical protein
MARQLKIQDVFNECADRMLAGCSVEDCLRSYPNQANELKPLLETLRVARQACAVDPRPGFRARARNQFRNAVAETCQLQTKPGWRWNWSFATVTPVVVALLMLSGGGVIAASAYSMPDQPLYTIKLGLEQAQLRFTPSSGGKVKLYALMADRRANEIGSMAEKGNVVLAESTAERMEESLNMIATALLGGNNSFNLSAAANSTSANDSKSSQAQGGAELGGESVPPRTATLPAMAAPATTAAGAGNVPTQSPPFIVTGPVQPAPSVAIPGVTLPPVSINVPTPTITLPPGTTAVPSLPNVDPSLLKFLKENAANPAALQSLLAKVPESSRPALLQAIALIQNYQQLLNLLAASNPGSSK